MEELDRVPAPQGDEGRVDEPLRPDRHRHVRIRAVDHLQVRPVEAPRIVDRRRRRRSDGHALGERRIPVRAGDKVPEQRANDSVARGNRCQYFLQRLAARPPEFVRVAVDNPIGPEVGRGEPGHAGHPFGLLKVLALLADQMQLTAARIRLEDVRRPVLRPIVRRDDEVDSSVQVKVDVRAHDVRLVAREQCHDELHPAGARSTSARCT